MTPFKSVCGLLAPVVLSVLFLVPDTFGQVAFVPTVGTAPNGQTMTVTPAVSADRRYVRLSVNPFFNVVNGFTSFTTPLGAVSGSGSGTGGLGGAGLGGALGGAGGLGGVGGLRSVGGVDVAGVTFNAGMNGVIGPAGYDGGSGSAQSGFAGQDGGMRAGALPPYNGGLEYDWYSGIGPEWTGWNEAGFRSNQSRPASLASPAAAKHRQGGTSAANKTVPSTRDAARKISTARRQKAQMAQKKARAKKVSDEEPIVKPKTPRHPGQSD